jgi:hypothetical protein
MVLFRKPDSTFRDHAENYMIAPTAGRCKRPVAARPKFVRGGLSWGGWTRKKGRHGIVSGNHNTAQLPPSDRPSGLRKENPALARSFRFRIPQPPAPRGRRDRACSQVVYPHTGPTKVGPFSFWVLFWGCHSGARVSANPESRSNNFWIPGPREDAWPQMCNCTSGNDEGGIQ